MRNCLHSWNIQWKWFCRVRLHRHTHNATFRYIYEKLNIHKLWHITFLYVVILTHSLGLGFSATTLWWWWWWLQHSMYFFHFLSHPKHRRKTHFCSSHANAEVKLNDFVVPLSKYWPCMQNTYTLKHLHLIRMESSGECICTRRGTKTKTSTNLDETLMILRDWECWKEMEKIEEIGPRINIIKKKTFTLSEIFLLDHLIFLKETLNWFVYDTAYLEVDTIYRSSSKKTNPVATTATCLHLQQHSYLICQFCITSFALLLTSFCSLF